MTSPEMARALDAPCPGRRADDEALKRRHLCRTLLGLALTLAGCHESFAALDTDAGGRVDELATVTAGCLGLDEPECTSCHRVEEAFVLRPMMARPTGHVETDLGLCLPDGSWRPITDVEAECLGLDDAGCVSCHLVDGVYYLVPRNTTALPDLMGTVPVSDCVSP